MSDQQTADTPEICPHYDLGPTDDAGIQICRECGQMILVTISGTPVEEFEAQRSTVVAEEGADVQTGEEH